MLLLGSIYHSCGLSIDNRTKEPTATASKKMNDDRLRMLLLLLRGAGVKESTLSISISISISIRWDSGILSASSSALLRLMVTSKLSIVYFTVLSVFLIKCCLHSS